MTDTHFFRQLVDHQFTAVIQLNDTLVVEHLNPSAELLLVRSGKQIIGQAFYSLFVNPAEIREMMMSAVAGGTTLSVRSAQWQLAHRDTLTLDYMVTPYMDDEELHLIVEMLPADRAMRISRDEGLIQQTETTRHLVRGVAHEIKNPLGGIRGAAQLLASELPSADLKEYTQVIIEEADRLRDLVDRMLGSHKAPTMSNVNIHQIAERVYALLRVECGDRIRLTRDYDPSLPDFNADEAQLIQAVLNIARNAVQALIENNVEAPSIEFKTRAVRQFTIRQNRYRLLVKLDIIDNGPGVAPEMMEKIFYPMISGRPTGTGLGLSIAQQIINFHNGVIECDSSPGATVFSVYLPLEGLNGQS
ncbi:nitrogen regulation protein NR(II) [Saccharospirillum sp.]|uniref:nitrogen regulation protein NR(II) n=1 Tax=Saccharospirillum sp. TaxID=2033801 RepID=UPI0034A03A26